MKNILKKYWFYILAFLLPWVVVLIHSWVADTWVTGGGSLLRGDMKEQLVPFYYELWNKVHTGGSFSYTWNICGGIDFHSILGYLISPFTLLVLVCPRSWISDVVQFIMVMKLALVSVSMVYYFYNTKYNTLKIHKKAISLFLGLAFALGNGMLNLLGYIQFNDVIICFPILILLVERMVENEKWKLYYLLMTFCMASNLYLMFQISIFLLLWFVFLIMGNVEEKGKKFFIFAGSSVLAALTSFSGICNSILLNYSRYSSTPALSIQAYLQSILVEPQNFIKQFFIFEPIVAAKDIDPNIYFSLIALVLAVFFLFIRIEKKQKLYLAACVILLTASFFIGYLSYVWHLFAVPNGVYHRFFYLFVFLMLFLALLVIIRLDDIRLRHIIGVGVIEIAVFIGTFFQLQKYDSFIIYLASILLLVLYLLLMAFYRKKRILYKNMLLVIACFGITELCINAYSVLENYDNPVFLSRGNASLAPELAEELDLNYGERVAWSQMVNNMGLVLDRDSDVGFISGMNGANLHLHQRLGMPYNGRVSYAISGASPVINLLFNIRYGISNSDMEFSDVETVSEKGDYTVYRINRLAGLGYMTNSDVSDWTVGKGTCFEVQNRFIQSTTGLDDVFHAEIVDIKCENAAGKEIPLGSSEDWVERGT